MNAYADLTTLKSAAFLNISDTATDAYLRKLLEGASRDIDKLCDREFYCWEGTRYFDGGDTILFLDDDILSVATFKCDSDGDGTYEDTFATTDYNLYPLNDFPKTRAEISANSDYGGFASGVSKGVQVIGVFGYGDGISATPYIDSGTTTAEALDATETGVDVASGAALAVGQTMRVESEQMYIQSISSNTATVKRGVNGTTAATHATGVTVYVYEYPMPVVQACLIQTMRNWKRKDTAFADVISSPELGTVSVWKGLDPDVAKKIAMYRKWSYK